MNTKQIIVFRKDLLKGEHGIRKGKFAAQVAHASLLSLLTLFNKVNCIDSHGNQYTELSTQFGDDCILENWLNGLYTKVVVSVDSVDELKELNNICEQLDIPHALVTDAGLTEFHGEPTVTCLGIGPYESNKLDEITGHLRLL